MGIIYGGSTGETLTGTPGIDVMYGLGGDDVLYGGDSTDTLFGGLGTDALYGGSGNDTFVITQADLDGAEGFYGGSGTNRIVLDGLGGVYDLTDIDVGFIKELEVDFGINNATTVILSTKELDNGAEFSSSLIVDTNSLITETFVINVRDTFLKTFNFSNWTIQDAGPNDLFVINGVNNQSGESFPNDTITGTNIRDVIVGQGGDDRIKGAAGEDIIYGGFGEDSLSGGAGNDTLFGGADDDLFALGNDESDESLFGGTGDDTLDLTSSISKWDFAFSSPLVIRSNAVGLDPTNVAAFDSIETLIGSNFNDQLREIEDLEVIYGGAGNDTIGGDIASNNTYDGDDGIDTVDLSVLSGSNYLISLASGTVFQGSVFRGFIRDFENAISTDEADDLVGNDANNVLYGGDGNDTLRGLDGDDAIYGGLGADLFIEENDGGTTQLFGGGAAVGMDTLDLNLFDVGVVLDKGTADGGTGDLTGGTTKIENVNDGAVKRVIGTAFDDVLNEGLTADNLEGRAGNDTIITQLVNSADEMFDGGADTDTLDFSLLLGSQNATFNMATGAFTGSGGAFNFENAIGNAGDNTITGTSLGNTIEGGAGADSMNGSTGLDTLSYAGSTGSVVIDLSTGAASGGDATGDTIAGFENVIGSDEADLLTGNTLGNTLNGGDGNDILRGASGADLLIGGGGFDFADYRDANASLLFDLTNPAASSIIFSQDTLVDIKGLFGSSGFSNTLVGDGERTFFTGGNLADTLSGNGGGDILRGRGGNDSISGGEGNDALLGNAGNDTLTGGANRDIFWFGIGSDGSDVITDFTLGADLIGFQGDAVDTLGDLKFNTSTGGSALLEWNSGADSVEVQGVTALQMNDVANFFFI